MLENAGITFDKIPADIDEDKILNTMCDQGAKPEDIALELGRQKAIEVSSKNPDTYTIGSDQILECDGILFQKAHDVNEARTKLKTLRGKTHNLISSIAVAHNGKIIFENVDTAKMTMHNFSDAFLEQYLKAAENDITVCVGSYAYEGRGAWLFESVDANYFTILGMPLLPLLDFLKQGEINQ